jgi:Flp pilus assembly protein TadG
MPGLSPPRRRVGDRLSGERGATAVLVAVLMVPLLGFAAIAVDVGALYAERARLQTAADAAALAVARDCALGNCGDMQATADEMVVANVGEAEAEKPELGENPSTVTVTGNTPKEHWFAPIIGHESTQVRATATVAWGSPGGGTASLPLIFSLCEWQAQTGGGLPSTTVERTITFPKTSSTGCTGSNGLFVPGGFGWLKTDGAETCDATSERGGKAVSEPGNNPSQGCQPGDFTALQNKTVLLPIFDQSGSEGSHAWYRVHSYAAFTITGYYFAGSYKWNSPCNGDDRCIRGYFTQFVEPSDAFSYDSTAPAMGAWILRLVR